MEEIWSGWIWFHFAFQHHRIELQNLIFDLFQLGFLNVLPARDQENKRTRKDPAYEWKIVHLLGIYNWYVTDHDL